MKKNFFMIFEIVFFGKIKKTQDTSFKHTEHKRLSNNLENKVPSNTY